MKKLFLLILTVILALYLQCCIATKGLTMDNLATTSEFCVYLEEKANAAVTTLQKAKTTVEDILRFFREFGLLKEV